MASTSIISAAAAATTSKPSLAAAAAVTNNASTLTATRRQLFASSLLGIAISATATLIVPVPSARAEDEEYVRDTTEVIAKLRATVNMAKTDPGLADAVAELRESSNSWVAKFRKEKSLLGRSSFRDVYSALNAISGHYISFGPTAPIPAKRKTRILEEVDTAEKALARGR